MRESIDQLTLKPGLRYHDIINDEGYDCCINNCSNKTVYEIEWWGVNQHGENPEVVCERRTCEKIVHLVRASFHEEYGGIPDSIQELEKPYVKPDVKKERSMILNRVIKLMDKHKSWKSTDIAQLYLPFKEIIERRVA